MCSFFEKNKRCLILVPRRKLGFFEKLNNLQIFLSKFFRPRNVLTSLQFLIFVVASFFCLCVYHFLCFEGFFVCMCVFFFFIISFFITLALQSASVFFAQEYQTSFSSIITFFHSAFFSGIFLAKFLFFAFQKKCKLKLD